MTSLLSTITAILLAFSAHIAAFDPYAEITTTPQTTYILNINTGKFHDTKCRHADSISERNRLEYDGTREELIERGFDPCKVCNP